MGSSWHSNISHRFATSTFCGQLHIRRRLPLQLRIFDSHFILIESLGCDWSTSGLATQGWQDVLQNHGAFRNFITLEPPWVLEEFQRQPWHRRSAVPAKVLEAEDQRSREEPPTGSHEWFKRGSQAWLWLISPFASCICRHHYRSFTMIFLWNIQGLNMFKLWNV